MVMMLKKLNPFAGERLDIVSEHCAASFGHSKVRSSRLDTRIWSGIARTNRMFRAARDTMHRTGDCSVGCPPDPKALLDRLEAAQKPA
jgi:hypothetical protein